MKFINEWISMDFINEWINMDFINEWMLRLHSVAYIWTGKIFLLTPWCRVLLEKLTGLQLVTTFPEFHGTQKFITTLTSVRHLSLSWASPIQSIYPHPTSCRYILISTHLRLGLPSGLLPSCFPTKILYTPSPHPYAPHAQPISFFSILSPVQYWVRDTDHLAPRYAVSLTLYPCKPLHKSVTLAIPHKL